MTRDPMLWHVRTDPACILYRAPRTPWGRWRFDRARGRACLRCHPCSTCSGPIRRTVGMVCPTCGKDYAR